MLTHLTTTPNGAQRSLITSVPSDFTCTSFPDIRFDPVPSPKETRFALNAGNMSPTPTRSYVFLRPGNPCGRRDPCKYYHKHDRIGRGNRQTTRARAGKWLWHADSGGYGNWVEKPGTRSFCLGSSPAMRSKCPRRGEDPSGQAAPTPASEPSPHTQPAARSIDTDEGSPPAPIDELAEQIDWPS